MSLAGLMKIALKLLKKKTIINNLEAKLEESYEKIPDILKNVHNQ